ncbi:MAG TPA: hypothetical protein VK633_12495, partial [Verrucomicrobiae bacterium]|nr:hypothetical protein [Verrucomicrobiae bacterium]
MKQWVLIAFFSCTGCRLEMHDQPKRAAFQKSGFFDDGASARPLMPGTIPRGKLRTNEVLFTGLRGTNLV